MVETTRKTPVVLLPSCDDWVKVGTPVNQSPSLTPMYLYATDRRDHEEN